MTIKKIIELALIQSNNNDSALLEARKTTDYTKVQMNRGVTSWKNKEKGNSYTAYCEFCGNLFEKFTHYKKDYMKDAKKEGWIIGNTKETKNLAVCPNCKVEIINTDKLPKTI